jgi:hypothetical protein
MGGWVGRIELGRGQRGSAYLTIINCLKCVRFGTDSCLADAKAGGVVAHALPRRTPPAKCRTAKSNLETAWQTFDARQAKPPALGARPKREAQDDVAQNIVRLGDAHNTPLDDATSNDQVRARRANLLAAVISNNTVHVARALSQATLPVAVAVVVAMLRWWP